MMQYFFTVLFVTIIQLFWLILQNTSFDFSDSIRGEGQSPKSFLKLPKNMNSIHVRYLNVKKYTSFIISNFFIFIKHDYIIITV
jgi:hypothetical protein